MSDIDEAADGATDLASADVPGEGADANENSSTHEDPAGTGDICTAEDDAPERAASASGSRSTKPQPAN